jgi:hypothetical protein
VTWEAISLTAFKMDLISEAKSYDKLSGIISPSIIKLSNFLVRSFEKFPKAEQRGD